MSGKIYQTVEESRLNEMHRALFISDKSYIMSPSWLLFLVNWLVFESWFFQFFFLNSSWGTSLNRGGSRIFLRRGCTRLLPYFNTNKPHFFFFFCRIPVVLENRRSPQGGVRTPCTLPLDPPLLKQSTGRRNISKKNNRIVHLLM